MMAAVSTLSWFTYLYYARSETTKFCCAPHQRDRVFRRWAGVEIVLPACVINSNRNRNDESPIKNVTSMDFLWVGRSRLDDGVIQQRACTIICSGNVAFEIWKLHWILNWEVRSFFRLMGEGLIADWKRQSKGGDGAKVLRSQMLIIIMISMTMKATLWDCNLRPQSFDFCRQSDHHQLAN